MMIKNKTLSTFCGRLVLPWHASLPGLRAYGLIGCALAGLALSATSTEAQDNYTYTGTTGTAAAPSTSTTFVGAFTDTTTQTQGSTPNSPANTLTFGGGGTTYSATDDFATLTLSGGLAFTNTTGSTVTIGSANAATINGTGTTLGFAVSTGTVAFAPAINVGTSTLTFSGGGTGSQTTLSGVISGSGGLTDGLTGGNITLSNNNNTYTGGTVINGGTLTLSGSNGGNGVLSGTPTITVNSGGSLVLTNGDTLGYTLGKEALVINSGGQVLNNSTGQRDTLQNTVTMTGGILGGTSAGDNAGLYSFDVTTAGANSVLATSDANGTAALINAASAQLQSSNEIFNVTRGTASPALDLIISSALGGNNPFTKTGNGILALTGANTYGGPTTVSAGTLAGTTTSLQGNITDNAALVFDQTLPANAQLGGTALTSGTYAGVISGSGTLTKNNAGTATLSGFSTFAGGTTVNGGTLSLANGGGAGVVQGVVTVNTGATLNLANGDALGYNSDGTQVTTLNVNGGTVTSVAGNNEGYNTNFSLMAGTVSAGSLFRFNVNAATPATISSLASGTTSNFNANIDDFASGGANASSILGISVAKGTTASGIDLTISGVIGSAGGLTKSGLGYLNLTGQNTFTGPVTINGGTVNVGTGGNNNAAGALGTSSATKTITVNAGGTLSGTINNWFGNGAGTNPLITVNGGTLTTSRYTAIGALALNGATVTNNETIDKGSYQAFGLRGDVTVGGTSASTITSTTVSGNTGGYHLGANTTFTVATTGAAGADLVVSAPLINQSGDFGNAVGGFTKAGAGTMLLSAANTYGGATSVNAGTLTVGSGGTLGTGVVTVNTNGTLLTTGTGTLGAGTSVVTAGTGALTLGNSVSFNSAQTLTFAESSTINLGGSTNNNSLANIIDSQQTSFMLSPGTYTAMQLNGDFGSPITTFTGMGELTVVPEPSTWAAGCVMIGLLGLTSRRKFNEWLAVRRS